MRRRIPKDEYAPPLRLWRHCANRVHDAIEWVRAIVETYDKPGMISSPTTTEVNLGNPWRCWESNPGPSAS